MIISLSGVASSGKDSTADVLVKHLGYKKLSFAKNLKNMCQWVFDLSKYQTDTQEGKESLLNPPIMLNKTRFNLILNWVSQTHAISGFNKTIKELEDKHVNQQIFVTPRQILQFVGTDCCRAIIQDYHTEIIERKLQDSKDINWACIDCRFENERDLMKRYGAKLVLIQRPNMPSTGSHPSETSLGSFGDYDWVLRNDGTLEDLEVKVLKMMKEIT